MFRFPKIWENRINILQGKHARTLKFQSIGFLKHLGQNRNLYNSQNTWKVNFHDTGNVWERKNNPKLWVLGEAGIHTISKTLEKWMPIVREKYEKAQAFQSYWFLKYFVQFPKHGESKFP